MKKMTICIFWEKRICYSVLHNLDDFNVADDIDFRSCDDTNGGSYTILKSGGVILIKKAGRNYMKFSFKEKFSANL